MIIRNARSGLVLALIALAAAIGTTATASDVRTAGTTAPTTVVSLDVPLRELDPASDPAPTAPGTAPEPSATREHIDAPDSTNSSPTSTPSPEPSPEVGTPAATPPDDTVPALPGPPYQASLPPPGPEPTPSGGADPTNYSFYATNRDGSPIRWNPCAPIHYVINPAGSPPTMTPAEAVAEIRDAIARVAAATGMTFIFDGYTDEAGSTSRTGKDPVRYPGRWAPVLIAYGDVGDGVSGRAQMRWAAPDGTRNVVYTGWLLLHANDRNLSPGFSSPSSHGRILLHELGHLVGLGHAARTGPIMNNAATGVLDYTTADRAGLDRVGINAGCLPDVPPP